MKHLPIIRYRRVWFSLSGALVVASIAALAVWGLRVGIDFSGGTSLDLEFPFGRPVVSAIEEALSPLHLGTIVVSPVGERQVTLRTRPLERKEQEAVVAVLRDAFPSKEEGGQSVTVEQFQTIGPVIGKELQRKTVWAVVIAVLAIVGLITYTFRKVSYPMKSWKYGVVTIVALLHDVIIPSGAYAFFGRIYGFEANALFVVALLTILGFSVHDTIVVFDRTRENLRKYRSESFSDVVNRSVNETFVRSVNTSFTLLIILLSTLVFGGESIRDFIVTLLIGVFFGTYSSIFIASPLLVYWYEYRRAPK